MEYYRILIREPVNNDLDRIPKKDVERLISAIGSLSENPRPTRSGMFSGEEKYRLRFGSYRIIYEINDDSLLVNVVIVRRRKDVCWTEE